MRAKELASLATNRVAGTEGAADLVVARTSSPSVGYDDDARPTVCSILSHAPGLDCPRATRHVRLRPKVAFKSTKIFEKSENAFEKATFAQNRTQNT